MTIVKNKECWQLTACLQINTNCQEVFDTFHILTVNQCHAEIRDYRTLPFPKYCLLRKRSKHWKPHGASQRKRKKKERKKKNHRGWQGIKAAHRLWKKIPSKTKRIKLLFFFGPLCSCVPKTSQKVHHGERLSQQLSSNAWKLFKPQYIPVLITSLPSNTHLLINLYCIRATIIFKLASQTLECTQCYVCESKD